MLADAFPPVMPVDPRLRELKAIASIGDRMAAARIRLARGSQAPQIAP